MDTRMLVSTRSADNVSNTYVSNGLAARWQHVGNTLPGEHAERRRADELVRVIEILLEGVDAQQRLV